MDLDGLPMEGVSIGGIETCLEFPSWKLAVDVGSLRRGSERWGTWLITHPHADHLGAIAGLLARRELIDLPPPRIVVPPEVADDLETLLGAWRRLDRAELAADIVPLAPGEHLDLGKGLSVRPFRTVHRVVSQGYLVTSTRKHLDPRLAGLPGEEIAARRRAGETIDVHEEQDELAVTGDTRIDGIAAHADVLRARRLVLEVTFLDERVPVEKARTMGHTHLDEVLAQAEAFENNLLCITHVSPRYKPSEVDAILDARLPAGLRQRTVWFR